jgi:hypothetical protein
MVALVSTTLVLGCTAKDDGHTSSHPATTIRLELDRTNLAAGVPLTGKVVVDNPGVAITITMCMSPVAIALRGVSYEQEPGWFSCAQRFKIAHGATTFPVSTPTTYSGCTKATPNSLVPLCEPDGSPPILPAGHYEVVVEQNPTIAKPPKPVELTITG